MFSLLPNPVRNLANEFKLIKSSVVSMCKATFFKSMSYFGKGLLLLVALAGMFTLAFVIYGVFYFSVMPFTNQKVPLHLYATPE